MEERSPGSYRLSVRGSLLRSPFGIRNVKVYVDQFPLTDAGGNAYLNLIDPGAIERAEIFKGPDGSLFGANSGGVVQFSLADTSKEYTTIGLTGGSYGTLHFNASSMLRIGKNNLILKEGWQQSQGYREQSAMQRQYFQVSDSWNYAEGFSVGLLFFHSDLSYQTPGGLNRQQFENNPRSARPSTATLPGAVEQNSGVHNLTYFGGLTHDAEIIDGFLTHSVSVFGSVARFENPFITNYEYRAEKNGGIRTSLNALWADSTGNRVSAWLGFEGQKSLAQIDNFQNLGGAPGLIMVADDVNAIQYFGFARVVADLGQKFVIELATSLNVFAYEHAPVYPAQGPLERIDFKPQWMPKAAVSWKFAEAMAIRASVAKGYSPPTVAEIRSSDNTINTALQAEHGWNYEIGMRMEDERSMVRWDWSVFYYRLNDAIVRRTNENGEEYFVNSGSTEQPGFESLVELHLLRNVPTRALEEIVLRSFYTYTAFRFGNYRVDTIDYGGKRLTGVPGHVLGTSAAFHLPFRLVFFVQHTFVSAVPLNDANDEFAKEYNLLEAKITWQPTIRRVKLNVFAGADNLLNESYSLGNDLNSAGRRYYNAAPLRNFFGGISVAF
jgi:iron complex outermembrane receptor protein